jgi:hypothetical protein
MHIQIYHNFTKSIFKIFIERGFGKFLFFLPLIFCLFAFDLSSIEVEGHITEDTTWSPDNNPYHVIDDVFVDDDVTLTILPGTEVKFNSTIVTCFDDFSNFIYYNGSNIAKMLWVDGKVIAEGTEEEPITFTRIQDSLYYHWGVIYLTENADRCVFKYCDFAYSARMMILVGILPVGAISIYNEENIIENCNFIDNFCGVFMQFYPQQVLIKNCDFFNIQNLNYNVAGYADGGIRISAGVITETGVVLISGNRFNESDVSVYHLDVHSTSVYTVYNQFINESGIDADMDNDKSSYFYQNDFIGCSDGIDGGYLGDSLYIKSNRFYCGYNGVEIHEGYVEISDNYFEGCDLDTWFNSCGKIFNNRIEEGLVFIGVDINFYNNIVTGYNGASCALSGYNVHNLGNIFFNNETAFSDNNDTLHTNCVILQNEELFWSPVLHGTDTFRNCIIDFELEYPLIDGGGNIIIDSLQAQTLFEDIQNGDFHLIEGSLAIDAGFDTLGYYYPFDMDYNHRVWDGDNNGSAIIDIGPYEYNSPAFGGIEGYTYNPVTSDPVDYVLLKINNQPGEFTFSDSIGNFEYKLPAGIYDVYAERVFYEDVIEYQVEVFDGQFTQVLIPMLEIVDVDENTIIPLANDFNLTNYPNPFNPETTIRFSVTQTSSFVTLEIYNLKGQKVTTLIDKHFENGSHTVTWDGKDSNNKPVASGIYFYNLKVDNYTSTKKMVLLK